MADADLGFEAFLEHVRTARGFDFTGYKRSTLARRVERRMSELAVATYADYVDVLEVDAEEFARLFNTIFINVTAFFRDPTAWHYLRDEVVPAILAAKAPAEPIRVWSAGCASGEEAFSAAIVLAEALGNEQFRERVKVYATDIDDEALVVARQAAYSERDLEAVPEELRGRYFEPAGGRYTFRNDLRRAVIFGRHDLSHDAPISKLDLLICRNTLMYFNAEAQARILNRFHFALTQYGYLFMGKAEMLLTHADLFTPVDMRTRIFRKAATYAAPEVADPAPLPDLAAPRRRAQHSHLAELAAVASPLAQLVVAADGTLVNANDAARTMFGLNPRDIGRPLDELEVSYRPLNLLPRIEQSINERAAVSVPEVRHARPGRDQRFLHVIVTPVLDDRAGTAGASVTFDDVTLVSQLRNEVKESAEELETASAELQSANEELETTNEELQSTNEELETTNEELQSTNEELETINEELQSTNEELSALNDELGRRSLDLDRANSYLHAILGSLSAAVIVVDADLRVRIWNHQAETLWGLRADEVDGAPLLRLDIGLPLDQLAEPLRLCLEQGTAQGERQLAAVNRLGRSITCRVSCTPLREEGRRVDGVVILMEPA